MESLQEAAPTSDLRLQSLQKAFALSATAATSAVGEVRRPQTDFPARDRRPLTALQHRVTLR
jgi:hypothetical protein